MRRPPSSVAHRAASLLRLLLAAMLLVVAAQGPPALAADEIGPRFAVAEPASDVVLPREAALQVERKAKKDASGPALLDCALAPAVTLPQPMSQWKGADPTRAPPSCGLPSRRPDARAPPHTI